MKRSVKKQIEIEKQRQAKNPGKANKERRKADRGDTFVGYRPVRIDDGKTKSKRRSVIKEETNKIIRDC